MNTKRLLTCLLAVSLLLASAAQADVAWEPDNGFYQRHRSECAYEDRVYCANGAEGFITLWNAPGGSLMTGQYENGRRLRVYWIYEDWGCITDWGRSDGGEVSGWVRLADLAPVYDYLAFAEEYADQIKPYGGQFAGRSLADGAVVNFFEYPGAAERKERFTADSYIRDGLTGDEGSAIRSVFVDEDGLTWGYVGYLYGRLNGWFCLDDPDGENFPVRTVAEPELVDARRPTPPPAAYVPWILVAAATAGTGALLAVCYRKKKRRGI